MTDRLPVVLAAALAATLLYPPHAGAQGMEGSRSIPRSPR
jgi:hypothetical protein